MSIFVINPGSSYLSRIDPRCRLVSIFVLAIAIALCHSIKTALAVFFILSASSIMSGGGSSHLIRRLIEINLFMMFVLLLLPFSIPGEVFFTLAGYNYSLDGLMVAVLMVLKANSIMVLIYLLIGCMDPVRIAHSLQALKIPSGFVQIMFFMIRYIDVLYDECKKMLIAAKARGFSSGCNIHSFRTYGNMFGMLFVRSLERSERIYIAMKCRGFRGRYYSMASMRVKLIDRVFLILSFLLAAIIIYL